MSNNNLPNLETSMKHIKPEGLTKNEKEYTWSKIEAGLTAPVPKFSYVTLFKRAQSRFVAGMVGLLILGGGAATAYAHNTKPGDFLFPVEIAKEKTQIFFAGNEKKREVLHIKFAEKRLAEVRELTALASVQGQSTSSTTLTTTSGTSTTATATPTAVVSKNDMKKIVRAEHAITIALTQLMETRNTLANKGNTNAALVIDDIIEELKGMGDGSVTITRIAAKGNDHNGRVSLRATINTSSSASSTFAGTVRVEEKKHGTTIVLNNDNVKTEVTLKNNESKKENADDDHWGKHEEKNTKHDDDDEDDDHDRNDRDDDRKGGKKLSICHASGTSSRQTLSIAVAAARAHIAHGDTLGVCLNQQSGDETAPVLTNITATPLQTSATISWGTNEEAAARIWLSTTSPVLITDTPTQEHTTLTLTQSFSLSSLTPGTTYYYVLSSLDAAGNRATSSQGSFITVAPGDTTPPAVSGTNVAVNTTSATLSFTTNENAKARVWVSSSSPVLTGANPDIDESSGATAHSAALSGLIPNTSYHYIIAVIDSAGNRATTSGAFTTTAPLDTAAPVISAVSVATTTSSATISWTTNESTNATIYYGQVTPVNIAAASIVAVNIFGTTHSAVLSGLTASAAYHYLIAAHDNAGNTATSTEQSFTIN